MLAETGRRSTNQALRRADVDRRYPILLATLAETYVEVLDELVQLLDQALAGADSRARYELSQRVVERAKVEIDRGRLLDEVLDIIEEPSATPTPDDWSVRGSGWRNCRPRGGRWRSEGRVITGISTCSPHGISTCAPSPQPLSPTGH